MAEVISMADFRKTKEAIAPQQMSNAQPASVEQYDDGDVFNYGAFMTKALIGMIGDILVSVQEHGIPRRSKLNITFRTDAPGVIIPASLRLEYPKMMMVALDAWWDNLEVNNSGFAVTLNFKGVGGRIVVPFASITSFVDPSVDFGLGFGSNQDQPTPPQIA